MKFYANFQAAVTALGITSSFLGKFGDYAHGSYKAVSYASVIPAML
jgi:hypothetical protein